MHDPCGKLKASALCIGSLLIFMILMLLKIQFLSANSKQFKVALIIDFDSDVLCL
jgi:hypothetical protein